MDWPDEHPESILDPGGDVDRHRGAPARGGGRGGPAGGQRRDGGRPGDGLARPGARARRASPGSAPGGSGGRSDRPPAERGRARPAGRALRDLLREFREGDLERALRRAPAALRAGRARGRGAGPGDQLPAHDLTYSLGKLLGTARPGGAARHLAGRHGPDGRAVPRIPQGGREGDPRRRLPPRRVHLRQAPARLPAAAHALLRGGLHHDAAVLFLAKLDDRRGAARAFEAAGEVDRAVELYRQVGEHVAAGDLLRRVGEEDAALAEYRRAAGRLVAAGAGHLAAGELLLTRPGGPTWRWAYFRAGWARRPAATPSPAPCGSPSSTPRRGGRRGPARRWWTRPTPSSRHRATTTRPASSTTRSARLARLDGLAEVGRAVRDRALLGLAAKLRQLAKPGRGPDRLPSVLGRQGTWTAAVAQRRQLRRLGRHPRPARGTEAAGDPASAWARRFRVGVGVVTAVASAPESGEVFLGFEGGEVYCFRPERSEVAAVANYQLPVAALGVDPSGRSVVVLRAARGRSPRSARAREPDGSFRLLLGTTVADVNEPWLTPVLPGVGTTSSASGTAPR